jgi:hypothetical protein
LKEKEYLAAVHLSEKITSESVVLSFFSEDFNLKLENGDSFTDELISILE